MKILVVLIIYNLKHLISFNIFFCFELVFHLMLFLFMFEINFSDMNGIFLLRYTIIFLIKRFSWLSPATAVLPEDTIQTYSSLRLSSRKTTRIFSSPSAKRLLSITDIAEETSSPTVSPPLPTQALARSLQSERKYARNIKTVLSARSLSSTRSSFL